MEQNYLRWHVARTPGPALLALEKKKKKKEQSLGGPKITAGPWARSTARLFAPCIPWAAASGLPARKLLQRALLDSPHVLPFSAL